MIPVSCVHPKLALFLLSSTIERRPSAERLEEIMRRVMAAVIVLCGLGSAPAFAGSLELRLGSFFPKADSDLFLADEDIFATRKSDWKGFTGGLEYSFGSGRNVELGVHLDGYGKNIDTSYRRHVRQSGGEIEQTLSPSTAPLGMTLRFVPGRRHARFRPYVGVGADIVFWEYKEAGSFIDFDTNEIVEFDEFESSGAAPAVHAVAGLRFGITPDIFLTAEGKYLASTTVDMGDDFRNNRINVSGSSATVGVLVRF
jgi:opacity protein-like surface antigen